jgi:hypothetical protein
MSRPHSNATTLQGEHLARLALLHCGHVHGRRQGTDHYDLFRTSVSQVARCFVLTPAAARQIYEVATQKGSDSWAFKGVVQAMNLVNGHSVHYRGSSFSTYVAMRRWWRC